MIDSYFFRFVTINIFFDKMCIKEGNFCFNYIDSIIVVVNVVVNVVVTAVIIINNFIIYNLLNKIDD